MTRLTRITVSLKPELVEALEIHSSAFNQTKSKSINDLLVDSIPAIKALAEMQIQMKKMNEIELKEFKEKLLRLENVTQGMAKEITDNLEDF